VGLLGPRARDIGVELFDPMRQPVATRKSSARWAMGDRARKPATDSPSSASYAPSLVAAQHYLRPNPARIAEIQTLPRTAKAGCISAEPQLPGRLLRMGAERTDARIAALGPLGVDLTPGPALHPKMTRGMAAAPIDCPAR
jgi:hypothetical protein